MSEVERALRSFRRLYEKLTAQADLPSGSPLIDAAEAEIAALRAENAELRSALERIGGDPQVWRTAEDAFNIARAGIAAFRATEEARE